MRLTRTRIVSAILIIGIVIVIAILVNTYVLTSATIDRPVAPPSVAAIRDQWEYSILLPTEKPECLAYDANGTSVRADADSSTGQALEITLAPVRSAKCSGASGSTIRITEAPALTSLSGEVSTVSHSRMQFAQVTQPLSGGQTEVTLQWHCKNMMCRMRGTTSDVITEDVFIQMANSFQVIESSS